MLAHLKRLFGLAEDKVKSLLDHPVVATILATPWRDFAQPEWNNEHSVRDALLAICRAREDRSDGSYDKLLFAVGNNHAGTYCPVVLETLPVLEEVLRAGWAGPRRTVLDALIDLLGSFGPEAGYEMFADASGHHRPLAQVLRDRASNMLPLLSEIANGDDAVSASLALELLDLLKLPQ